MPRLAYSRKHGVAHICGADPRMAVAVEAVGSFRLKIAALASPLDALVRSITFQSVSTKAATTIHARLIDTLTKGNSIPLSPERILRVRKETLRKAGLSWAKVEAVRDLARKIADGTIPDRAALTQMDDAEIIERIVTVRGIGQWTVEMLLIFSLGRPDVLPATDLGVRKGFARVYQSDALPSPRELIGVGERWRPYRSVASWYLWRAGELPSGSPLD